MKSTPALNTALAAMVLALAGCGQTGPLTMPNPPARPAPPSPPAQAGSEALPVAPPAAVPATAK